MLQVSTSPSSTLPEHTELLPGSRTDQSAWRLLVEVIVTWSSRPATIEASVCVALELFTDPVAGVMATGVHDVATTAPYSERTTCVQPAGIWKR